MVIHWNTFQFSLKEENEDICFADDTMAWVLDGASGLYKMSVSDHSSDAAWYVKQINSYLKEHLQDEVSITKIIENAIVDTKEKFLCFPNANLVEDYPSCAAAIIKIKNNVLEYYVMADCELLIKDIHGKITRISDQRVSKFDDRAIQIAIEEAKKTNKSVWECRDAMLPMKKLNRKMKNKKDGYFALADDPSICHEALTGIVDIADIESICMCSDGFAQYYETMKIVDNEETFFEHLQTYSLKDMHDQMYQKQQADSGLSEYPRFRLTDDNTIIYGLLKKDL